MSEIKVITRADDAGSSSSANLAMKQAAAVGFIKNVSLLAPGGYIDGAADLLCDEKHICFGLHTTLNAEWDKVKWKPLSNVSPNDGLTDEDGYLLPHPKMFYETRPSVETVLREYEAQLDRLNRLGFDIRYVDSHMGEEAYVEGLSEAKREWAIRKGLIYHEDCDIETTQFDDEWDVEQMISHISSLCDGQYLYVAHPALYGDDMLMTGNSEFSGESIAKTRSLQASVISDIRLIRRVEEMGVSLIRYDEASMLKQIIS